ncbi:hypothetical protein BRARA_I04946 [Brassica rapa]|uniref:CDP-diacylglycerol--serine O-phosphatidyltransferase n=1 Tax=Brassica campestris TaxID=3711 RepID=A0A397Y9D6_BRACM|nr:hypothetical protein BRARA_I04946 [Brassica rapa]
MEPNGYMKEETKRMNGGGGGVAESELDPWTAWAYKPRTISLLLIGACLLIWASGALDPESTTSEDIVTSVKRGVWAMIAVFLAYSLLQAPSTVLIRPHPAIWRLVHGLAVIYLVSLTFLLFQRRDDARQFMKIVPNRDAIVGSDTLGKCGTWTCCLFAGLDMEDTEDLREKETLSSSSLLQQR